MSTIVNIEYDRITIPEYAKHNDGTVAGFFGKFAFLSNFYPLENGVSVEDLMFPSVEAAYQALKWPSNNRTQFVDVSASQSKKLGRLAPNFNSKKWDKQRDAIMIELTRQKYDRNYILKQKLILTDGYTLEERNNWSDTYWGTDINGNGDNRLGKILMSLRDYYLKNNNDKF